jgi:hypothetical protein
MPKKRFSLVYKMGNGVSVSTDSAPRFRKELPNRPWRATSGSMDTLEDFWDTGQLGSWVYVYFTGNPAQVAVMFREQ